MYSPGDQTTMFPTPASFPLMLKCFVQHPFASVELMSIAPLANPAGPVFLLCPPILGPLIHNEDGSERFAVLMLIETSWEVELNKIDRASCRERVCKYV